MGFALACLASSLAGCAGPRGGSEADLPDLPSYGTYAWEAGTETPPAGVGADVARRIRGAVDERLAAMGLRRGAEGDARLLVDQEVAVELKTVFLHPQYASFYTARRYEEGLRTSSQGYGVSTLTWVATDEEPRWKVAEPVDGVLGRFPRAARAPEAPGE